MDNAILKQGDLVKYHSETPHVNALGFVLGQIYEVSKDGLGLYVRPKDDSQGIALVTIYGELTDATDHFTKVACPVVLSRGTENIVDSYLKALHGGVK